MINPTKMRDSFQRELEPSDKKITPVTEVTMYTSQFPILLKSRFEGKTVAEAAEVLGIAPQHFGRLLAGEWKPTKGICKKMGLKVVYALTDQPRTWNL